MSGSLAATWGVAPGWGAVVLLPGTGEIKQVVDPAFDPTKAADDVLPLAAAIQWYHYARKPKGHRPRVDIATDSMALMVMAQDPIRGCNGSDWRFMNWFETAGYEIRWIFLGAADDDIHDGIRRELDAYAHKCQAALAAGLFRR